MTHGTKRTNKKEKNMECVFDGEVPKLKRKLNIDILKIKQKFGKGPANLSNDLMVKGSQFYFHKRTPFSYDLPIIFIKSLTKSPLLTKNMVSLTIHLKKVIW